jgi:hypothetical protein
MKDNGRKYKILTDRTLNYYNFFRIIGNLTCILRSLCSCVNIWPRELPPNPNRAQFYSDQKGIKKKKKKNQILYSGFACGEKLFEAKHRLAIHFPMSLSPSIFILFIFESPYGSYKFNNNFKKK